MEVAWGAGGAATQIPLRTTPEERNMNAIGKWVKGVLALFVLVAGSTSVARAQYIDNTPFDPRTWIPRPSPPEPSYFTDPISTRFTLINTTNWHIAYRINNYQKPPLQAHGKQSWSFSGSTNNSPTMHVSIDRGNGTVAEYDLQDGRTYYVRFRRGGCVDLYTD
jgi:hypothetical protein